MVTKEKEQEFFENYIKHLPQVPLDAPIEPGRLYHKVIAHDDWCAIYNDAESDSGV